MSKFQHFLKATKEEIQNEFAQKNLPIPTPDYLLETSKNLGVKENRPLYKHQAAYEAFCRWSSLPKELRKPETQGQFEKQYKLPREWTSSQFKTREDFNKKRMMYFWEWMAEVFPDVVYAVYKRAKDNSSKDAQIFIELLSKQMNLDRPQINIPSMVLVGVSQEKLDKMFIPQGYENIQDLIPQR